MNTRRFPRQNAAAIVAALALVAGVAAIEKGGTVFSKRNETSLRAEPSALAAASGVSWDEVTTGRERKARERGAFRDRLLLIEAD